MSADIRDRDYDLYLSSLFIPSEYRIKVWELQSFLLEMERISRQDSQFKSLKYSFWIDALENDAIKNPRSDLLKTFGKHKLLKIIKSFKNRPQNVATLQELEVEAEATISQMFYLMLEIMQVQDLKIDHGASHVGQAIGIIKVLKGTASNLDKTRIPTELWAKYKLSTPEIYRKNPIHRKKLQDLVFELGTRANDHLITSLSFQNEWPKKGFPVLLNYVPAKEYLKKLEKCDFDLFHYNMLKGNASWNLPLKMLYYARRRVLK